MNNEVYYGTVVWFTPVRGYGFIEWEKDTIKQKDIFVHFSDIQCEGFKTLNKGQEVSFKLGENKHGVIKAIEVAILLPT
jgi:cold shock protein